MLMKIGYVPKVASKFSSRNILFTLNVKGRM